MKDEIERIRMHCVCDDITGCWTWRGATSGKVPAVSRLVNGKKTTLSARRVVYQAYAGIKLQKSDCMSTQCGNDLCLNPKHLKRSTLAEVRIKSANTPIGRARRSAVARRTAIAKRKLDWDKVDRIRQGGEPSALLAAEFGVSTKTINEIRRGEAWVKQSPFTSMFCSLIAANDSNRRAA